MTPLLDRAKLRALAEFAAAQDGWDSFAGQIAFRELHEALYPAVVLALLDALEAAEGECAAQTEVIKGAPWYKDIGILQAENAKLRAALLLISAMAGHPDAAEGCRNIIACSRQALGEGLGTGTGSGTGGGE